MKLILLSGGSGKRLWPLSNDSRSKQFLKVLPNKKGEVRQSMVQRVWEQLENIGLEQSTIITTSSSQLEMIQSQLGNKATVIVEPERRDTFPAIALTVSYLFSELKVGLDETIAVLPVDPYVEDNFFLKLLELEELLNSHDADLGLIGVKPTYPSEKYGYIVPKSNDNVENFIEVSHFKEKPDKSEASRLIDNNALWNCGVFAFKLGSIISILENKNLPLEYNDLFNNYDMLPKISFDYEVVENTKNIVALPYNGSWKDLGTWNTLTEEMDISILGKGNKSIDCENAHIINELDIPVSLLGVSNVVVAVSPDGILISDKEASPRVKELVGDWEQRPMYEERWWGWYKVLDYTKYSKEEEVLTKRICIYEDKNLSYHYHSKRSEVWTVTKGEGVVILNGESRNIQVGDVIEIPRYTKHAIMATSEIEIIEIQSGSELVDEDITRLFTSWTEIEVKC
ncbi:sugar phosphate nucleotidyltransferase [Niallia sp. Man26]|uniref:sugar phosphate nucleotidyltransferase n=1 Tax=Niallia sp. Man26 TaxID=2912824 RepID=UPI001EDC67A0|nr:sugar phosphate nucleotidyltransferase [Niallia sp. Man26]UPO87338.1 cupin domain-containing protein [Niallia sp. Man26]